MKKVVYVIACIALVLSLGIVTCAASGGGYSPKAKVSGMGLTIKPIVIDVRAEVLASMVEDVHLNNPATSRSVSYYDAMLMQRKPVYSLTGEEMFDLFYEGCTPEGKQEIIDGFKIYKEPVLTYAVESDELALYSFTTEESEAQIKWEAAERHAAQKAMSSSRGSTFTRTGEKTLYAGINAPTGGVNNKVGGKFYLTSTFKDGTTADGLFFTENTANVKGRKTLSGKTPLPYTSNGITSGGYQENVTKYPALKVTWSFTCSYGGWSDGYGIVVKSDS